MSFVLLAWKYRKIIGTALAVVAIAYVVWDYGRDKYNAGYSAGSADVQAKWDADSAARDAEIEQMAREHAARDAATKARNEEVIHGYQDQVSRIAADRDSLASRLWDNEVRIRALSEAADKSGASDAAAQPESARSTDAALDAYDRACRADAAQLEALIRQVNGQLDSATDAS